MSPGRVDRRSFSVLLSVAGFDRSFDLMTDDALNAAAECFILAQLVIHDFGPASAQSKGNVAVFRFSGYIAPDPIWWNKRRATFLIVKFHFSDNKAVMTAPI